MPFWEKSTPTVGKCVFGQVAACLKSDTAESLLPYEALFSLLEGEK